MVKAIKKHLLLSLAVFIFFFAFALRIWNLGAAGQVFDENSLLRDYSYYHVYHAAHLDFGNDFWWKGTPDHPPLVRYMRGMVSLLDIVGWDKNHWPIYSYDLFYDRMLSVILTSFAAVLVFLIGARYISLYSGLVAGIIFSMLPIPLGHSQLAMIEPLALFFFPASMFSFFLFLEKPTNKRLTCAGIALGFAVLARETHLMLIPMMLITIFFKHRSQKINNLPSLLYKTLGIFGLAFLTFFALWPMPFFHLDYIYQYNNQLRFGVKTPIPEVFFGELKFVPITYYFFHFIITTPLFILLFFFIGSLKIYRTKNWVWYSLILWFCFPFLLSFYHNRQQGIRYIIQICIPLALIAALGFETVINKFAKRLNFKILALILLFMYQFIILWRITPYYIDYFNILVGGAKNVYEKRLFQLAWWGEGTKEAFDYLEKHVPKGATIGEAVSPDHILPHLSGRKVVPYKDEETYDYVVVNYFKVVRLQFDDSKIRRDYQLVYSVMADGARLVDVYRKR